MRLTRIVPKIFGRFSAESPLNIPRDSFVVIYGNNETGKSTYLDMTVALLSKDYDKALMERYGEVDKTTFSGSIMLEEEGETLTVEFGRGAKVPKKSSGVPRMPQPAGTTLWERIASLELATVRNLFRITSLDISDGQATKTKFREYGLGDRKGQSVTGAIDDLLTCANTAEGNVSDLEQELLQHRQALSDVESTSDEYARLLKRIEELEEKIKANQDEMGALDAEIKLVQFCDGAAATHTKAIDAQTHLDTARENGVQVPVKFGETADTLDTLVESISKLDIESDDAEVASKRNEIGSLRAQVEADLQAMGMSEEDFGNNPILMSDVDRHAHQNRTRTAYARLKTAQDALQSFDIEGPHTRADEKALLAGCAREEWDKFDLGISAHEFTAAPSLPTGPSVSPQVATVSRRNRIATAVILVSLAVISTVLKQYIGAAGLTVLAVLIFPYRRTSPAGTDLIEARTERPTLGTVLQVASHVIAAELADTDAHAHLKSALAQKQRLEERINEEAQQVETLLAETGLADRRLASVYDFDQAAVIVDRIASELSRIEGLSVDLAAAQNAAIETRRKFSELRDSVIENLTAAGMSVTPTQFPSPNAVVAHVRSLSKHYAEQKGWREAISDHQNNIAERLDDAVRITELLAMDKSKREQLTRDASMRIKDLEAKKKELREEIGELSRSAEKLGTTRRSAELNLLILETKEKIFQRSLDHMRFGHLAAVLETRARERAELARPVLHRRVQEMVLSVADDWQSVDFTGEVDVTVTYQNGTSLPDGFLSTGGRTLLFTAMRIAIMQQEAEDPNAPSLPLLCDDPLLHLDDYRTKQAFRMMKEQASGHQIIYFTCKEEIKDLAKNEGVPVITIG